MPSSHSVLRNVIFPKQPTQPATAVSDEEAEPQAGSPPPVPGSAPAAHESGLELGTHDMDSVLAALVENAPAAMAMFDRQMRYVMANRQWVLEFGLQGMMPLVGRSHYEVFPKMHAAWREVYESGLEGNLRRWEVPGKPRPGLRQITYRWEVRPWRRPKDAAVVGLMVTCEKFALPEQPEVIGLDPDQSVDENSTPVAGAAPVEVSRVEASAGETAQLDHPGPEETTKLPLDGIFEHAAAPMVMLDDLGLIVRANAGAMAIALCKGIQEGQKYFWEVFGESREQAPLRQHTLEALSKLADGDASALHTIVTRTKPAGGPAGVEDGPVETGMPARWLLTVIRSVDPAEAGASKRFLAIGVTNASPFEVLAHATVQVPQPVGLPPVETHSSLEIKRLEEELSRARQEQRMLQEAERALVERESRHRSVLEAMPCGILVLNERGRVAFQNEQLTRLLGRAIQAGESVEDWLGAACPTGEHRDAVTKLWREDVWRRQIKRVVSLATADGLLKELELHPRPVGRNGGLLVSIQDVTATCRLDEQLRSTEAKFRAVLQDNPVPVLLADKAGNLFEANHAAELLLGRSKAELRRLPLDAWLTPESVAARREALTALIRQGSRATSLPVTLTDCDGKSLDVRLHLSLVLDTDGHPHCSIHFLEKTASLMDAASQPFLLDFGAGHGQHGLPARVLPLAGQPVAPESAAADPLAARAEPPETRSEIVLRPLVTTDVNGRVHEWTARAEAVFGFNAAEVIGQPLHLLFRPSDPSGFYHELAARAAASEEEFAWSFFGKDGLRGTCPLQARALGQGAFDVELVERVEEEVLVPLGEVRASPVEQSSSLRSRRAWPVADLGREELLLSETHHRIKNHLQIISSLLNLQSNTLEDQGARDALRSSRNRISAIAALHQHLYQVALGNGLNFAQFAQELVEKLRQCYEIPAERVSVRLDFDAHPVEREWLMPLALTLNEALSNALEHGFPGGRTGTIVVTLKQGQGGYGSLRIEDDGIGLPELFDPASSPGLGLKILTVFAEQMRGELRFGRRENQGTLVELRFLMASADN